MKKIVFMAVMLFSITSLIAQDNRITISGGYVDTKIESADVNATGYRVNGLYEFVPMNGNLCHGISLGFLQTKATTTADANYTLSSWPLYYAPKYTFGSDKIKGFLKGALGTHLSSYKRTRLFEEDMESLDWGFYGGVGAGVMFFIKGKLFINAEYEWAYLSNSYYRDGFVNSIQGGIGLKF